MLSEMNITPSKSPKFVDTSLKKYPFSLTRARRIFVCLKELYSAVCSSILLNISGPNLIELRRSWIGKLFSVLFFRQPVKEYLWPGQGNPFLHLCKRLFEVIMVKMNTDVFVLFLFL